MPLREQDRAIWVGDPEKRPIGSSGKVRACAKKTVLVGWGGGEETICRRDKDVVTYRQAVNRGIEPWASSYRTGAVIRASIKAKREGREPLYSRPDIL